MAVLNVQRLQPIQGGLTANPNLTAEHWQFEWINQFAPSPFLSELQPLLQVALTASPPILANGVGIQAQGIGSFVDDFYHRIHISPAQLDLGNVVSAQTTPVRVWNAHLIPQSLTDIDGLDEGINISGQPSPPLLFTALQEREYQVSVTPDGQPVLDTTISWVFANGEEPGLRITANRIIAWSFAPDWGDGIRERLTWKTDILVSESFAEQRRALMLGPRRELSAPMYVEGRERQLLDLALFSWGARVWAVPIWHEIQFITAPVAQGAMRITCATDDLDFRAGGLAMLRSESAFEFEVVEIDSIDSTGLNLRRATQQVWPASSRLYPARPGMLMQQPELTRLTDMLITAEVDFLIMEPSDWPELPAGALPLYRGRPVLEARPDETEDLTRGFERLMSTLDNQQSTPLVTDTAGRAMPVTGYRWLDMGRAARAFWRSLAYTLRGMQTAMWIPTHADDLTLIDTVSAAANTLDVANCGYARFGQARPGRRDIRIELYDGTVFYRRISAAAEISPTLERLVIDQTLGLLVAPSDVMRICWMVCSRSAGDTFEIEHMTDSEGVAAGGMVFRGVRDDEF